MHGYESQDNMSVDKYSTAPIVITRSISTQTGGISIMEKNERQIIRPKTAKINRSVKICFKYIKLGLYNKI